MAKVLIALARAKVGDDEERDPGPHRVRGQRARGVFGRQGCPVHVQAVTATGEVVPWP